MRLKPRAIWGMLAYMYRLMQIYHNWRRKNFPASKDDIAWRHEFLASRLDSIEARLNSLQQRTSIDSDLSCCATNENFLPRTDDNSFNNSISNGEHHASGNRRLLIDAKDRIDAYIRAAKDYHSLVTERDRRWFYMKPFDPSIGHSEYFHNMHNILGIIQSMRMMPGSHILEVGCGVGWITEILVMLGYQVTAFDPSEGLLKVAHHRLEHTCSHYMRPEIKDKVRFLCGTLEDMEFEKDFDGIIFYDVLHHIVDEEKGLANCAKWLRPGGMLGIIEGAWLPGNVQMEAILSEEMATHGTLENPFTQEYLDEILEKVGFVEIERLIGLCGFHPVSRQHETLMRHAHQDPRHRNDLIARKAAGWKYSNDPTEKTKVHLSVSKVQRNGRALEISMSVQNTGNTILLGGWSDRIGAINFSLRKGDLPEKMIEAGNRATLPKDLCPGEKIDFTANFVLNHSDFLGWSLEVVAENIAWLSTNGSNVIMIEPE